MQVGVVSRFGHGKVNDTINPCSETMSCGLVTDQTSLCSNGGSGLFSFCLEAVAEVTDDGVSVLFC